MLVARPALLSSLRYCTMPKQPSLIEQSPALEGQEGRVGVGAEKGRYGASYIQIVIKPANLICS